jgi:hypothetical protein
MKLTPASPLYHASGGRGSKRIPTSKLSPNTLHLQIFSLLPLFLLTQSNLVSSTLHRTVSRLRFSSLSNGHPQSFSELSLVRHSTLAYPRCTHISPAQRYAGPNADSKGLGLSKWHLQKARTPFVFEKGHGPLARDVLIVSSSRLWRL